MAARFEALVRPSKVRSRRLAHAGGSAWLCTEECGPHQLAGRRRRAARAIDLYERTRGGFDGEFYVGPLHASCVSTCRPGPGLDRSCGREVAAAEDAAEFEGEQATLAEVRRSNDACCRPTQICLGGLPELPKSDPERWRSPGCVDEAATICSSRGLMSHEQSALLASLAAIRGFVTSSELARTSPAELVQTEDDPFERLCQRSANRSLDEGAGTKLDLLTKLRVEVIARCLAGLAEADRESVAHEMKIPVEELSRVQASVAAALTLPDTERDDTLAREIYALDVADLVGPLRERGLWPGNPTALHVREYLQALADTVAQHSRLAFWVATRWVRQPSRRIRLAALDGLAEAIERFDPKRGFRLTTYAEAWIRQRVQRAFWSSVMPVRMPVHLLDQFTKVRRQAMRIAVREERSPTLAEVVKSLPDGAVPSEQALSVALSQLGDVWEIHRPDGEPEFQHLFDEQHVTRAHAELRRGLMAMVDAIPFKERTRDVLWRRFGLEAAGAAEETLVEIGESYGITRERIRQVERDGLDQLARMLGGRLASLRKRRADH